LRIYVFCDMEGVSGVSGSDYVSRDGVFYGLGRKFMTADINACARGCFQGGAQEVWVRDGHGCGNHVLWEDLDARVELIQGAGGDRRMPGLDECDALILLGYHAMAGTPGALLEHTYSSRGIQNMWMNGRLVGEFGVDAGIAADMGKPTIMTSGDDKLCAEAKAWIPEIVACQVKTGLACQGARLLAREKAHMRIETAAAEAVKRIRDIPPLAVTRPVTIRREMVERGSVPNAWVRPEIRIIDGRTYEATADTVERALSK